MNDASVLIIFKQIDMQFVDFSYVCGIFLYFEPIFDQNNVN